MPRLHLATGSVTPIFLPALLVGGLCACDPGGGPVGGSDAGVTLTGCTPPAGKARPPTAPDGYYVNGNTICTLDGSPHLLHGVDRPSLEWDASGEQLSAADFAAMASWRANVVRVALNQDFWLSASPSHAVDYPARVDAVV